MLKFGYESESGMYMPDSTQFRIESLHRLIERVRKPKARGRFKSELLAAGKDPTKLNELERRVKHFLDTKCKTSLQRKQERHLRNLESKNPRALMHVGGKIKKTRKVRNKTERKLTQAEIDAANAQIKAYEDKIAAMKQGYTACGMGNIRRIGTRDVSGRNELGQIRKIAA